MGILDDAIREHLDLKKKHGARDTELSDLEDDAFGSGDRPDPFVAGEMFGDPAQGGQGGAPAPGAPPAEDPTRIVDPQGSAAAPAPPAPAPPQPEPPLTPPPGLDAEAPPAEPPAPAPAPDAPP